MKEYRKRGNAAIQHAIEVLPTLQERLRKSPAGALLSGLQYRLELVAAVAGDGDRPDDQRLQAASAILYLNEIHDAIPDTLGYIGLLDDDFALRVVLDEVGGYTEDEKIPLGGADLCALGGPSVPAGSSVAAQRRAGSNHVARPH